MIDGTATLAIEGMSCASCAAGIEKRLGSLDGVDECSVNFATHTASVAFDPARVDTARLVGAVEEIGYGASLPASTTTRTSTTTAPTSGCSSFSAALTLPLALVAMIPALHFSGWEWFAFALATPVVFVGGLPFHRVTLLAGAPRPGDDGHADLDRHARRLDAGRRSCCSPRSTRTRTSRSPA